MSKLDDLYALEAAQDRPRDPPFFTCDPIIVSDEVQAWPLDGGRCLWWLRPSVDGAFIHFVARQQAVIITDDYQAVVQHWTRLRKELYR